MSGIYRQHYIPADPPPSGKYVIWRKGKVNWDWEPAYMSPDGEWRAPNGDGEITDVHWYMDVGGEETRQRQVAS